MKIALYITLFLISTLAVLGASSHSQFIILETVQKHDNAWVLVDDLVDAGYPITNDYSRAQMRVLIYEMQEFSDNEQSWQEMERIVSFIAE